MYTELDRLAQLEFAEQRGEKKGLNIATEVFAKRLQAAGFSPEQIEELTALQ